MPFSTPGKKPRGTEPPTTFSANSTPRAGVGLELDPDVAEHAVAAGLLLVPAVRPGSCRGSSRGRGPSGVRVAIAAPNLRLSRSVMTATWASPIARRICSPVSLRSTRAVGSSSSIRWSAGPILSRSPLDTGSIATWRVGSGKSIGPRWRAASRVVSVSPVSVTPSFATAPISPARSSAAGSCSLPWRYRSWPMRSSSPRSALNTVPWLLSVPDSTRR